MTLDGFRWTAGVVRHRLANGLTLLAQSDPEAPAVGVVIHVRAGFFDEPDHWQGISHVLEHMFFKGTPTRGVGQIAADTKALGGYLNAATSYDWTSYYVVLPAAGFAEALAIQADALQNAAIDAEELGRELQVIIEEAKRKRDTPSALAQERLHALLFDRHRIRRWRIGTEEGLSRFTRDDVFGYYRSRYVPERTIVSVVGSVPLDEIVAAVDRAFGAWPARPGAVDPSPDEPWRRELRVETIRGDVKQADLVVGWRGLPDRDPLQPALDLGALVLSSGRGSWLYQSIRLPGIATSAAAYHYSPTEVGVFSVAADLPPPRLVEAVGAVAGQVERLRRHGPDQADLARAKTLLTTRMARRLESVDGRASAFALAEAAGGIERIEEDYRTIMGLEAAPVREAAERYLDPAAVSVVSYLPPHEGDELDPSRIDEIFRRAGPAAPSGRAPVAATPVAGGRAAPGARVAGVLHVPLPGVDLLILRKAGVPLATVGLYRRRRSPDPTARAGLATLAVRAATRGAGGWDGAALADRFEALGGTLGSATAADWFGFGATVLGDRAAAAAALLDLVLRRPRFDPVEVERERATLVDEARQAADDMFRRPLDLALAAAFGDRGYGLPVKGTPEALATLGPAEATEWHRAELEADRTAVVVVGEVDPDALAGDLAGIFADHPPMNPVERAPASGWDRVAAERLERRAKAQTGLAMVFPGPDRAAPDRHAALVLATIASGLGGRLFHALREKRSLAYTVLMSSWQRARAGALVTYIATSPEREDEARREMLAELARFATDLVAEDELRRAVNYLAGQALVQRQTGGAVASEIVDAWLLGTGLEELADPAAEYRAVTREAVREVASRSLDPARRAEGVVRGGMAPG